MNSENAFKVWILLLETAYEFLDGFSGIS